MGVTGFYKLCHETDVYTASLYSMKELTTAFTSLTNKSCISYVNQYRATNDTWTSRLESQVHVIFISHFHADDIYHTRHIRGNCRLLVESSTGTLRYYSLYIITFVRIYNTICSLNNFWLLKLGESKDGNYGRCTIALSLIC